MNQTEEEENNGNRLRQLEESVEANPDDASLHFDLGVCLWETGGEAKEIKEKAAEHFVLSAKLNPENAAAFKYLGHYYSRVALDSQRATKCYQRAVSLNPNDPDSGEALCDLLDRGGKESLELAICREASEKSPRAFWAFRRLGYLQLHQNKLSEAVQSLQHAIRGYPTVADLWEALGVAYQRLGMLTASIKAYARAIELDESRIFAIIESANIFLMLGSYREGVEHFQQALRNSPQNVSALYGLASGLLAWSKEIINLGAFRWGASLLEDACKVAIQSAKLAENMSCIWKLLGDIQLMYARCLPWTEEVESLEFDSASFNTSILSWKKTCYSFAASAIHSYQRALHLAPWQANLYTDIAIASDFIATLNENFESSNTGQLPEKMVLGALLLESGNSEFWVALGCLSHYSALRQHALIRGLQLDVSLATAWAYLGQLYRESDDMVLAKQAFGRARSIDPSLALAWAGSADCYASESIFDEAFESCLRAAQILPLAEFQIGLAKLALSSGNLSSPQVFGAIKQAVQRAPYYSESHNLLGLICEARSCHHAAVASYRLARSINSVSLDDNSKSYVLDISVNLARSLSKAGNFLDAAHICEELKNKGTLDAEGLQIYAFSLCKIGENNLALSVARELAASLSKTETKSTALSVSFICRLLYYVSGRESAIKSILKMPKDFFQSSQISFIVSAIHSIDQSDRLQSIVSSTRSFLASHEEITGMHYLIALGKLIKTGSKYLDFQKGVAHLRKALHMYPNSKMLRELLGYLLVSSEDTSDFSVATRCSLIESQNSINKDGLKSALEIFGGAAVSCNVIGNTAPKFSFPTCHCQCLNGPVAVLELQRTLHQEPWNHSIRYLLILNLLQKAREEKFPHQLCAILERLITIALSDEIYSEENTLYLYQKFQLLICASELSLQKGNFASCISLARKASELLAPDGLFFAHLQLCRAYASEGNVEDLQDQYDICLKVKTHSNIGWVCLKLLESQFEMSNDSDILELSLQECSKDRKNTWKHWMYVYNLASGLVSMSKQDLFKAEKFLEEACLLAPSEGCLLLCHGAACMALARRFNDLQFLSRAVKILNKAQVSCLVPLPIVSALLAQAQGSLGSKEKWEKNLRLEWFSWPPELRPAELYFQMHLLARKHLEQGYEPKSESEMGIELCQSPEKWVLRAIHTDPSCQRYWNALPKLLQCT